MSKKIYTCFIFLLFIKFLIIPYNIGTNKIEEYWSGEKEKKKLNTEYFGIGDLEVSDSEEMLD